MDNSSSALLKSNQNNKNKEEKSPLEEEVSLNISKIENESLKEALDFISKDSAKLEKNLNLSIQNSLNDICKIYQDISQIEKTLDYPIKNFLIAKRDRCIKNFIDNDLTVIAKVVYYDECLRYAKKCSRVAEDFCFLHIDYLEVDPKIYEEFFLNLINNCVLDCKRDQDKIHQEVYANLLNIKNIAKKYENTGYVVIENNIIALLNCFLDVNHTEISLQEIKIFFEHVFFLIINKPKSLKECVDEINKIKSSKSIVLKKFIAIHEKLLKNVYQIDICIRYGYFLYKLAAIAESNLDNDRFLSIFISLFVAEFDFIYVCGKKKIEQTSNEILDIKMSIALIYKALNKKLEEMNTVSKSNIIEALSKLKKEYKDLLNEEFPEIALNAHELVNKETKGQIQSLPNELSKYFHIDEINCGSQRVKIIFTQTLHNYCRLSLSEEKKIIPVSTLSMSDEINCGSQRVKIIFNKTLHNYFRLSLSEEKKIIPVSTLSMSKETRTFRERGRGIVTAVTATVSKISARYADRVKQYAQNNSFNAKPSAIVLDEYSSLFSKQEEEEEEKKRLDNLSLKLATRIMQLQNINSFLQKNVDQNTSTGGYSIDTTTLSSKCNEKIEKLEQQYTEIEKSLNLKYKDAISKFKIQIENASLFKNRNLSLKERVNMFFSLGLWTINLQRLKKLFSLNDKVDFVSEKDFFLKAKFRTLLNYGIICWPWLNKEKFATKWSEKILVLKIIEIPITEDIDKIVRNYCEILSSCSKKYLLSTLNQYIQQANNRYLPQLVELKKKVDSISGSRMVQDSRKISADCKRNVEDSMCFVNTAKSTLNCK